MTDHDTFRARPVDQASLLENTAPPPEYSRHEAKADVLPTYQETFEINDSTHLAGPSRPPHRFHRITSHGHRSTRGRRVGSRETRICWTVAAFIAICIALAVGVGVYKAIDGAKRERALNPQFKTLKYKLLEVYEKDSFFDHFDFFTDNSNETYTSRLLNADDARNQSMVGMLQNKNIFLGIAKNASARIVSKRSFSSGLFVFQIKQLPRHCTYVSAIRLSSSASWPAANDIRIAYHQGQGLGSQSIKTSGYCNMNVRHHALGPVAPLVSTACNNATNGCLNLNSPTVSPRNDIMTLIVELQPAGIRFWSVDPKSDPDYSRTIPDTSQLRTPDIEFPSTDCDISKYFRDLKLVADVNVCGDYGYLSEYTNIAGDWCSQICSREQQNGSTSSSAARTSNGWIWSAWTIYQAA